jgi:hypothetical protein
MLEVEGVEAGADELVAVVAEPPQAVRLSRAAAATPATVKVVRLNDCISILLVSADHCLRRTKLSITACLNSDCGHRPLVGVSMGIRQFSGNGWVNPENCFSRTFQALGLGVKMRNPGP